MIDWVRDAFHYLMDVKGLVQTGGTFPVCLIVFVETGLFAAAGHRNRRTRDLNPSASCKQRGQRVI
jgi:hypothetical protein